MPPSDQANISQFLDHAYKSFQLLKHEDGVFYHYWKGKKEVVVQYFDGISFPSIKTMAKLQKMPDELNVLLSSSISKKEMYGVCIMKININGELQPVSFVVHPEYRRRGLGLKLLLQVDDLAKLLKVSDLSVKYRSYWKSNMHWEKMLEQAGWSDREIVLHYFSLPDANSQFHKDWFQNAMLPEGFETEVWNETCFPRLEETLATPEWEGIVPKELTPFQLKSNILSHASLLLLKEGEIVGWLICHLLQTDTAQITTLFTHPKKARGVSIPFIAEAGRTRKLGLRIVFMVQAGNHVILNMINKYLASDDNLEMNYQYKRSKSLASTGTS